MTARELESRRARGIRDRRTRAIVRGRIDRLRGAVIALAVSTLCVAPLRAQQRTPAGWEEGLFDVAATGLPQSSIAVLVTPRGKFLLPVQAILDPLAVPYHLSPDSGVLSVGRPAGIGT